MSLEKEEKQKQRQQCCLYKEVSIGSDWVKQFLDMSEEELFEVVSSGEVNEPNVDDEEDDDCVILDCDPEKEVMHVNDSPNVSDELLVVGEKGQIACRDYPHPRHLCATFPYDSTPHDRYCAQCHCYVCDSPAPCVKWGNGLLKTDHCHATDKSATWKTLRKDSKLVKTAPVPASANNGTLSNVVNPQVTHILPYDIERLSSNSMLVNLKSRAMALRTRRVNLTPQNQASRPSPVNVTPQRPVNLTPQHQAYRPSPVNLTTQNQASFPGPANSTLQNQASFPRPVNLTLQNQASRPRLVNLTPQNQASRPRPVNLTTQNQASRPHPVTLTPQNQAYRLSLVNLTTQNQVSCPYPVNLTFQNQAYRPSPVNLTPQNQASRPTNMNACSSQRSRLQNQASRPTNMNVCSSQRSRLQNQALRSNEMHPLSVNLTPQNQASQPITINAINAFARSNKTHPLSENLTPQNQASQLITMNAISSLTSRLQNQMSNNVLGRSTGPSFTIPNGANNSSYQEPGSTLVTNKYPSHAASRMSLGVRSHVIQKQSGHRVGIGNTPATNRVTPLGASGFINRVNPQHGDTNHAAVTGFSNTGNCYAEKNDVLTAPAIDLLLTQPNNSPAYETQQNEHQIGSEDEKIINSGATVQNVFQQKLDGGIENEGFLAKDSNTNAKESNTPFSGNTQLSLDEIKHWLLDSN